MDASTLERFMAKVQPNESGCWLWMGSKNYAGYGMLGVHGKMVRAHRLAFEYWCGPIGEGKHILHACDVPACVNPAHLSVGTQTENMADMRRKGRQNHGERNGHARLTASLVHEIRLLSDHLSASELARQYGISAPHAWDIIHGKRWQHVA